MLLRYCDFCGQQIGQYGEERTYNVHTHQGTYSLFIKITNVLTGNHQDACRHCQQELFSKALVEPPSPA